MCGIGIKQKIEYEIDKNDLYQIDNMSLDNQNKNIELRKRAFERELKNTYEIERKNSMTCIRGNKVNKIYECNLMYDLINPHKRTKHLNIHYSPIIQGSMNIRKGK